MMEGRSDEFILSELWDTVICLDDADHHERGGYTVNLQSGNYENDLQAAEDGALAFGHDIPLITGSVTTDVNGERQNPDKRMLEALLDVATSRANDTVQPSSSNEQNIPVISYTTHDQTKPRNHWDDPSFFPAAFPTLFPTGFGGHLDKHNVSVSLAAFADWALSHHCRRYATSIVNTTY